VFTGEEIAGLQLAEDPSALARSIAQETRHGYPIGRPLAALINQFIN
jgi:hypothetical protein